MCRGCVTSDLTITLERGTGTVSPHQLPYPNFAEAAAPRPHPPRVSPVQRAVASGTGMAVSPTRVGRDGGGAGSCGWQSGRARRAILGGLKSDTTERGSADEPSRDRNGSGTDCDAADERVVGWSALTAACSSPATSAPDPPDRPPQAAARHGRSSSPADSYGSQGNARLDALADAAAGCLGA